MIFEYIASGLSFVWKNTFDATNGADICAKAVDMTDRMLAQHPNHKYGVLFNAYTEKSTVQSVVDVFGKYTIQADSGGLQMLTLAHGNITDEAKDKIYRVQAKYATIGMSFDEIPVRIVGHRAEIHDMGTKYFDPSMIEECAIASGKNLTRQIEVYLEEKSKCKPLMIIQGNCMETYKKWTDIIIKQVPQDYWPYIAGISSSSFSLGNGLKQDVERAFTLTQLQIPDHIKKHVHLLGVGAMNRLIPAIQFRRSGLFTDDMLFSYDSTKHTGGCIRGQYQQDSQIVQLRRTRCPKFHEAYLNISDFSRNVLNYDMTEDDFYMVIIRGNLEWTEKYGGNTGRMYDRNVTAYAFLLYSVNETMKATEKMINDETYISKIIRGVEPENLYALSKIKTLSDYNNWVKHAARHLTSKSVRNKDKFATLEEFM
jgi:hypothetical protein